MVVTGGFAASHLLAVAAFSLAEETFAAGVPIAPMVNGVTMHRTVLLIRYTHLHTGATEAETDARCLSLSGEYERRHGGHHHAFHH